MELELRLQQFIELVRSGDMVKYVDAIMHARKHLAGGQDTEFGLRAGGLLANPPPTYVEPYRVRSDWNCAVVVLLTRHSSCTEPPSISPSLSL